MSEGLIFIKWEDRQHDMMNIASCGGSYEVDSVADEYYQWLKSVHGKYANFDFQAMPKEEEEYMVNYIEGLYEDEE
jgi:hypothetical protein